MGYYQQCCSTNWAILYIIFNLILSRQPVIFYILFCPSSHILCSILLRQPYSIYYFVTAAIFRIRFCHGSQPYSIYYFVTILSWQPYSRLLCHALTVTVTATVTVTPTYVTIEYFYWAWQKLVWQQSLLKREVNKGNQEALEHFNTKAMIQYTIYTINYRFGDQSP